MVLRIISGLVLLCLTPWGFALPSSKRLFQSQYGFKVSCNLCHTQGGGSRRNEYGKAFFQAGFQVAAFKKIEVQDSDRDGVANLQEIQAKSNPGDSKSTPQTPGDWLQKADEISVPRDQLLKIFPDAEQFAALEGEVQPEQVKTAERLLGRGLTPEEKVPTYYFSIQGQKRMGVAQFFEVREAEAQAVMGFGVDAQGKLLGLVMLHGHHTSKALPKFLSQLKGQTRETLKIIKTQDIFQGKVVAAIQGLLGVMNQVFSETGKK